MSLILLLIAVILHVTSPQAGVLSFAAALASVAIVFGFAMHQRPAKPFVITAAISGAVCSALFSFIAFIATAPLLVDAHHVFGLRDWGIFFLFGVIGSSFTLVLVALIIGPNSRRLGLVIGALIAFIIGRAFAFLLPERDLMYVSTTTMHFWLPIIPAVFMGLDVSWFMSRDRSERSKLVAEAALLIIVLIAFGALYHDMSSGRYYAHSVKELENAGNTRGLIAKARSSDPNVQNEANLQLFFVDSPDVTEYLVSVVKDRNSPHRATAAFRLHEKGDNRPLNILIDDLSSPDPRLRIRSIEILQTLKDPRATPHIRRMMKDPDPTVRAIATEICAKSGG